jgi:hypothetical protein
LQFTEEQVMVNRFPKKTKNIKVEYFNNCLTIIFLKSLNDYIGGFIIAVLSPLVLTPYFVIFIGSIYGVLNLDPMSLDFLLALLLSLIFFLIGIVSFYNVIACLISRKYIIADDKKITISEKPLPSFVFGFNNKTELVFGFNNKTELNVTNIKRLYTKFICLEPDPSQANPKPRPIETKIYAEFYDSSDKILLIVNDNKEALFIENALENHFNITDETSGDVYTDMRRDKFIISSPYRK